MRDMKAGKIYFTRAQLQRAPFLRRTGLDMRKGHDVRTILGAIFSSASPRVQDILLEEIEKRAAAAEARKQAEKNGASD